MSEVRSTEKKLDELYELIKDIEIAMMTTRRADGHLVTRPMATQDHGPMGDLWFVTDIDTHKVEELEQDPHIGIGYLDGRTREWVSVSGTATISQDRAKIRELWEPDWKMWFGDEGGERDGGPDDPRLALIIVDAHAVHYMKGDPMPKVLFEMAKSKVTGERPEMGREEHISRSELAT